jgi:hypothetical protein
VPSSLYFFFFSSSAHFFLPRPHLRISFPFQKKKRRGWSQVKSLEMVSEIEEFCDNEEHSIFERRFADAILFCTWA